MSNLEYIEVVSKYVPEILSVRGCINESIMFRIMCSGVEELDEYVKALKIVYEFEHGKKDENFTIIDFESV